MLKAIADMKPDQIVAQMKQATLDLENDAPELKDTVDPRCFDAVGRSIKFLQKAAKELTPAAIDGGLRPRFRHDPRRQGFRPRQSDGRNGQDGQREPAFDAEMKNREQTYAQLGGDNALLAAGWPVDTDKALKLDLKRKIEILQIRGPIRRRRNRLFSRRTTAASGPAKHTAARPALSAIGRRQGDPENGRRRR